jgi:hypothetical protein
MGGGNLLTLAQEDKKVKDYTYGWIEGFDEFLLRIPSTIYGTPALFLGTGDGYRVRGAFRWLLTELRGAGEVDWLLREEHDCEDGEIAFEWE